MNPIEQLLYGKIAALESTIGALSQGSGQIGLADETVFGGGGDTFPWDKVAFGYKLDPNGDDPDEVLIYGGEYERHAVSDTYLTVADDDYAYLRWKRNDDALLIANAASVPADDAEYKYYKLYQFTVADGVASLKAIWRPFAIEEGEGGTEVLPEGGLQYQVLQRNADGDPVWDYVRWV